MLRKNDIPHVAILMGIPDDWGRKIVKGIISYANNHGSWNIWIGPQTPEGIDELPADWCGHGVIGRIVSPKLSKILSESALPVVNVADSKVEGFTAPCVRTDDKISTRLAVDFFVKRGFRNIAFAGPSFLPNARWYSRQFQKVLAEYGLTGSVLPFDRGEIVSRKKLIPWLQALPKPVGILAYAQGIGRSIVDSCMEVGIQVPHDAAVLSGSYEELLCHACRPALSGILLPTEQIGYKAAELLHRMMHGEDVPHETTFIPPLGIKELLSTDTLAVEDTVLVPLVRYLQAHAFEPITMDDLLKKVPMSRSSLERRYHKAFGRTPFDEIRSIRIDRARKLLTETGKPLQIIAEECGFTTYNYLAHVFKLVTGTSPSAYRKKMRMG